MTKYLIFPMLIFSSIATAGDGPKRGTFGPDHFELMRTISANSSPLSQNGSSYASSSFNLSPPRIYYEQHASNNSRLSSLPSIGAISLCFTIGQGVFSFAHDMIQIYRSRNTTVVSNFAQQETSQKNEEDEALESEVVESHKAVQALSITQIKLLAESEEQENSASHYFRDKYDALKDKEIK